MINTVGGGFSSFRTKGDDAPLGLTKDAVRVRAWGDGKLYKLTLHTADSW